MFNGLLLLTIFLSPFLGLSQDYYEQSVIQYLTETHDSSITEYKERIAYFQVDRLHFLSEGIFIQTDEGELLPLPHISFREGRYYLAKESGYICSTCGAKYPVSKPNSCYSCGGTSFSPYWDCNQ